VTSFEDPALGAGRWEGLLAASMDPVFLRLPWQRLWWQVKGEGDPILVLAERGEELLAVAPLFAASGILMLVGSGNADSLDFLGRPDGPTLVAVLQAARDAVPQFSGIELYHLPESSPTCALLPGVATALGLGLHSEPVDGAPYADLNDEQIVEQLTSRRSVRKEEARMRRAANLHVREATAGESEELIEIFLRQHGARWREAGHETFNRPGSRELVRAVVEEGLRDGWVSLTVLEWSGAPVAIDISLLGEETQMNWLVSSDPAIRDYSPGRVLQAHVIRAAVAAGKRRYDFGLGEEKYKLRNASGVTMISNWFMYS
jgi:CelD/BcsL family acetyltransferase involved in cellulose biosynthesis